jgi:energy-converting hydrogenase Eha subunit F
VLGYGKGDAMFGLILAILIVVPLELGHAYSKYSRYMARWPYNNMAINCPRAP